MGPSIADPKPHRLFVNRVAVRSGRSLRELPGRRGASRGRCQIAGKKSRFAGGTHRPSPSSAFRQRVVPDRGDMPPGNGNCTTRRKERSFSNYLPAVGSGKTFAGLWHSWQVTGASLCLCSASSFLWHEMQSPALASGVWKAA
jgi:hypothetical protein